LTFEKDPSLFRINNHTDNQAEAPKKKPAAKRKTREEEPEPEYDLFENKQHSKSKKSIQEAVLDSVQANNCTLFYLVLILNFYLVFFLCDNKFSQ